MDISYIGIAGDCEHNSSVALIENGKIIYAEQEERLSGIKGDGRFPFISLKKAQFLAKYKIVYCITGNDYSTNKVNTNLETIDDANVSHIWKYGIAKLLKNGNRVEFVEHHTSHMASGILFSGFDNALIITADGQGDGLSLTVSVYNNESTRIFENQQDWGSPGFLYAAVTKYLGYKPLNGEGKLTALAASGRKQNDLDDLFSKILNLEKHGFLTVNSEYINNYSRSGTLWTEEFSSIAKKHNAEDISLALQNRFENILVTLISSWLEKKKQNNLVVAGGVFANVSLNRKIQELKLVNNFFITPYMGDEGTSLGAAAWIYHIKSGNKLEKPKTMFLGSSCDFTSNGSGLEIIAQENIEEKIGELLASNEVVARVYGRMEFGPRALGNHSILYQPNNPLTIKWLNNKLGRSEVMPFAPAILEEYAHKYLVLNESSHSNYEFMTTSFMVTSLMKSTCRGVVHKDSTVRPQIVKKENNPSFHKIINEYFKITGTPVLLNTSFNNHGLPIVSNPKDAILTCKKSGIKYLQINNTLFQLRK